MSSNLPHIELDPQTMRVMADERVAIGVSGGSDSLALLLLLHSAQIDITALTVDHGLREEARAEAEHVRDICASIGVPHEILSVKVEEGNLQAEARRARYTALQSYCVARKLPILATAHTLDDQAETFFLNAFRGSGVDGLAAMPRIKSGQPRLVRPCLGIRRQALRAYLEAQDQTWIDDPSNDDPRFDRVKMRDILKTAEGQGFAIENLARSIDNMKRMRDFLKFSLNEATRRITWFSPLEVETQIDRPAFLALHEEIQLRLLAKLCQFYGRSPYKPRLSALENLALSIESEQGGQVLEKTDFHWSNAKLRVCAEPEHLPEVQASRQWSRFDYQGWFGGSLQIGPLGSHGPAFDDWRAWGISARAAASLPMIYRRDAPVLADWENYQFESFMSFLQKP